jgi:hypothetical protein
MSENVCFYQTFICNPLIFIRLGSFPHKGKVHLLAITSRPIMIIRYSVYKVLRDYFPRFYPFKTNLNLNYKDPVRTAQ